MTMMMMGEQYCTRDGAGGREKLSPGRQRLTVTMDEPASLLLLLLHHNSE